MSMHVAPPRRPELPNASGFCQPDIRQSQIRFRALLRDLESEFESMIERASKRDSESYSHVSNGLSCAPEMSSVFERSSAVIEPGAPSTTPSKAPLRISIIGRPTHSTIGVGAELHRESEHGRLSSTYLGSSSTDERISSIIELGTPTTRIKQLLQTNLPGCDSRNSTVRGGAELHKEGECLMLPSTSMQSSSERSSLVERSSAIIELGTPVSASLKQALQNNLSGRDSASSPVRGGVELHKDVDFRIDESMALERWCSLIQKVFKGRDNCVKREEWAATPAGANSSPKAAAAFVISDQTVHHNFRKIERKALTKAGIRSTRRHRQSTRRVSREAFKSRSTCISHPDSPVRRLWMVFAFLMIVYEFFAISLSPFKIFTSGFARSMELITGLFWLFDIFINFTTGIYIKGRVEMTFRVVAKKYVSSWFLFDFLLVVAQLAALWTEDEHLGASGALKLVRVTRSIRLKEKFMRLQKDLALSAIGNTLLFVRIFYCSTGLFLFVHCNACLFYEVGHHARNGWVSQQKDWLSDSGLHNYLVALHWSLSQMQGSIDIFPGTRSTWDRLFCVASSCLSIVVLALVVSVMTDTLVNVRQQRKRRADENFYVSVFFSRHDIRPEIRARAEHHLRVRERRQETFNDNELNQLVLQMFPAEFSTVLLAEIQGYQLTWHPVFKYLEKFHRPIFIKACSSIITLHSYEPNDDAFTAGSYSTHAHIIVKGAFVLNVRVDISAALNPWLKQISMNEAAGSEAIYCFSSQTASHSAPTPTNMKKEDTLMEHGESGGKNYTSKLTPFKRLEKGCLVCEAALWMYWMHVGSLCSVDHGQSYKISSSDLGSIIAHHPVAHTVFSLYADRFVKVAESLRQDANGNQKVELMAFHTVGELERPCDSRNFSSSFSEPEVIVGGRPEMASSGLEPNRIEFPKVTF